MHECDACGLVFGGSESCPGCGSMVSHAAPESEIEGRTTPDGPLPGAVQLEESMDGIDGLNVVDKQRASEAANLPFQLGGSSGGSTSLPFGMGSPSGGLGEGGQGSSATTTTTAGSEPPLAEPTSEDAQTPSSATNGEPTAAAESTADSPAPFGQHEAAAENEPAVVKLQSPEPEVLVARIIEEPSSSSQPSTASTQTHTPNQESGMAAAVQPHQVGENFSIDDVAAHSETVYADEGEVVYHDFGDELDVSEVQVDFDSLVDPAEAAVAFDPEKFHDGQPELVPARALPLEALPSDLQSLADQGFTALGAADWEGAANLFRNLCEHRPTDAASLNNFGLALLQQALIVHAEKPSEHPASEPHFEAAVLALRQAAKARQDDVAILTNLATSLTSCLRHEAALMVYDAALKIDENDTAAHNGRAVSLIGMRRFDEAVAELRQAAVRAPENRVLLENLRRVSPMG